MTRVAVLLGLGLLLVASGYAQQDDPHFTGKTIVMEGKELTAARRHFDAGARSAWHSHDKGQLLMVEEGRMRSQKRGQAVKEFGVHESEYTEPNVVHWHGATPSQPLTQINVGFGGQTQWLEKVTDSEYGIKN